jgi:hypothetical protein
MEENNKDIDNWLIGLFEGQISFSVNIGLSSTSSGKRKYVIFKPYITIVSVDYELSKFIKEYLDLETNIDIKFKKKEYFSDCYSINVQKFDDIDKIIQKISLHTFRSKMKNERFERFVDCYNDIKKIGHIHSKWNDEFKTIVKKKLLINKRRAGIENNRFDEEEWLTKMTKHLESDNFESRDNKRND